MSVFVLLIAIKEPASKTASYGGGYKIGEKKCSVGPNDLIFFPVKIEINPDFSAEISTGNTSEISTTKCLKSANMRFLRSKISDFRLEICCR